MNTSQSVSRREFVKASAILAAASASPSLFARTAWAGGREEIRVGVIGCGGRGTGAAYNAIEADPAVRVVALADLFENRLSGCLASLQKDHPSRVDVPPERRFTGFDAFRGVVNVPEVDYVILATPPHFRPAHFDAAVNAGKHVFFEKPVAVDPAGVRRVIAAASQADAKRLSVVTGTQRRHEDCYLAAMRRLHDGAIGEVISARCYWNQGGLWHVDRTPPMTDMEWQCRNWLYFCWLSGDHIVEQHVHNLDVVNWVMGGPPVRCMGMGGRQVRTGDVYGNVFDHFAVEYEYEGGRPMLSMCRQIDGCENRVEEIVHGTTGTMRTTSGSALIRSPSGEWRAPRNASNPYVQEHVDLIASIRGSGERLNEAKRVAESCLTAIMGRMSAYTGKAVTWEQALNSSLDLAPPAYEFGPLPVEPVPVPGRTPLV